MSKRPHLESGTETHPGGKKSANGSVSASSADAQKGAMGVGISNVLQSTASSSFLSLIFQVGMHSHFLDQWRGITSNRFVLKMVHYHHLQLRSHPSMFCKFWQFSVKVAAAHHPIIQKEVNELL